MGGAARKAVRAEPVEHEMTGYCREALTGWAGDPGQSFFHRNALITSKVGAALVLNQHTVTSELARLSRPLPQVQLLRIGGTVPT